MSDFTLTRTVHSWTLTGQARTLTFSTYTAGEQSGATVHADLTGRNAADSHPIAAITGLQAALDAKVSSGEPLQDAVGAMAGDGLVYSDASGELHASGAMGWVEAPSDGTETEVTVTADGRLSAQVVEVLDGAGGGEEGRATIVLPDPAEVTGQAVYLVVPPGVPGPTLHAPIHVPGVLDLTGGGTQLEYPSPVTVTWELNGDEIPVTLSGTYADVAALGAALYGPLLATGDVTLEFSYTILQTEVDGAYDAAVAAALVTTAVGDGASISVVSGGTGDPLGLEALAVYAGAVQTVNGVDEYGRGHAYTHVNRDSGGPHGGLLIAGATRWRWVYIPLDRSELIGMVTPTGAGGFFASQTLTNVGQALGYVHTSFADPTTAADGDVLTWDDAESMWVPTAGGGGGTVDVVSNVATSTILGRVTAGSGDSEELTAAQVRTLLNVADGAEANEAISVAGQDEGATVSATSATTLLDSTFSVTLANNGDSATIMAWGTTLNNSSSSKAHTFAVDWGNLSIALTPSAFATSVTARPFRIQIDARRESATEVHVSVSVLINNVAAVVGNGISTTSHASPVTVDIKGAVATGGSQEITLASAVARYFPAA